MTGARLPIVLRIQQQQHAAIRSSCSAETRRGPRPAALLASDAAVTRLNWRSRKIGPMGAY